jgi:MGT family glycosyltransferase
MEERPEVAVKDYDGPKSQRLKNGLAYLMAHGEAERTELERTIARVGPDLLIVDVNAYGAIVCAEAPAWLDAPGDPWVLVTCSTDYQRDERLAAVAVEALRDEPVRVIVTLADAHGAAALPRAENVRVERFVPHGPVLERAAAVVCHGGMGIVQKAVAAAVPVVAVPFGRDQPEVARRVVEAGAGVALPLKRLEPRRLREAVRTARARGAEAALASARLRAAGGAQRFADAAEELADRVAVTGGTAST